MRNSITLNGISSNTINGLLIQSLPPITKPLMRTEIEQIDGRAGDIVTNLGFSSYNKEFTIGLYGDYDVDQVIAFFNSEGIVTFSNEPDKYYNYQIIDQIDFERLIRFKTAKVTMHCQPFKYCTTETPIIVAGVNLISFENYTQTLNGITITADEGNISLSGTSSANTEIYMPINAVSLDPGDYEFQAFASGTNPEACSLRLIYNSPSSANSFGGTYITLANNMDVNIESTLSETKTYNYLYFYISSGQSLDFRVAINLAMESMSDSGSILMLDGTGEAPFAQFDLKGNSEQEELTGKNLLNYANIVQTTRNGVTCSYDDTTQTITLDGTCTADNTGFSFNNTSLDLNGTYTLSYEFIGGSIANATNDTALRLFTSNWVSSVIVKLDNSSGSSTSTRTGTFVNNNIRIDNGVILSEYKIRVQLEKSSSATSFEPYCGGISSPNPNYPQNIKEVTGANTIIITGKNLLNPNKNLVNIDGFTSVVNADGSITTSGKPTQDYGKVVIATYITDMLENGATYTFSQRDTNSKLYLQCDIIDKITGEKSYIALNNATSKSITIDKSKYLYRYVIQGSSIATWGENELTITNYYQIEKNTSATTFEKWDGQNYSVNLGDIELRKIEDYQDYLFKQGGKWYKHKEVGRIVYDGTEDWIMAAMAHTVRFTAPIIPDCVTASETPSSATPLWCKYFNATSPDENWNTPVGQTNFCLEQNSKKPRFTNGVENGTGDLNVWKSWVASVGLTVYYPLETPVDNEISDEALIEQLNAIESNAHTCRGRTHIIAQASTGNVPYIMDIKAPSSSDGIVINAGNIVAKPKLIIYGSGDIAIYLNGNQLFNIALGDENYITIDTNLMEAYKDTPETLKNRLVDGDYNNFALQPGENTITFSGSVDKCIVEDYSRWL